MTTQTITANGNTPLTNGGVKGNGLLIKVWGTFASASLTLGFKAPDGTIQPYAVDNTAKTAATEWTLTCGHGEEPYIITASATGSTSINWEARSIE